MKELLVATGNRGKFLEIEAKLGDAVETFYSLEDFPGIPKVEEDGATFTENALKKGQSAAIATGKPVIADDSGLEVDILEGRPGVHSARYSGENATDSANNEKLLHEIAHLLTGLQN
jgi:XTP/dITP diphosphohydrolase